ncbi:MAG: asparagine--tRNA ligase [Candidatus Kerfeldbacteria bacterium]
MTTPISQFSDCVGREVAIRGWVYNLRSSGKIAFLQVRDGSGFAQAIVSKPEVPEAVWEAAGTVTIESSVEITGTVSKHPKKDEYELQVQNLKIIQVAEEYPIGKKEHGPDFLLNHRHLWLRVPKQWAVLRLRRLVKAGLQGYYDSNGFIQVDTPIFTPTSCEGTTDLFEVEYFDTKAYLTQNGQLYLEALCMSFGKVYDLGPNFRAEKSKTRKHLTEFWSLNPEMAYVEHEESLRIQEESVKHMMRYVLEHGLQELTILERDPAELQAVVDAPFIHMTYNEVIPALQKLGSDIAYGDDLGADDEELLTRDSAVPVIVKNWPGKIKPFYMKQHPENPELVLNADMLAPRGFGEIIGGSQREDDYDTLKARMEEARLPIDVFDWYLDLRKYGSVPHSGFGFGIERLTRWMAGIHHIRETIPFPRMINRLTP